MQRWWGEYALEELQTGRLHVGPAEIWIQNLEDEWRIGRVAPGGPFDAHNEVTFPSETPEWDTCEEIYRIASTAGTGALTVVPMLPDRPVITTAEHPLKIPARQEATIYVSVPLWLQIVHGPSRDVLVDLPLFRPSDSWFGPTTMEGELCYASRMPYRTMIQNVPLWPHRAITAIVVKNRSETTLQIDRVKLPVRHLSVFFDAKRDRIVTESVMFKQMGAGDVVELSIDNKEGRAGRGREPLSSPREKLDHRISMRAFQSLFRGWEL